MAKFLLSALALASTAYAQCNGSLTIKSQSDATAISGCSTYTGDITIDPSVSGNLQLNGVGKITGSLIALNVTGLTSLSSDLLATITDTLNLQQLTVLSNLQMSSLTGVNKINWITLPNLQALSFAKGISSSNMVYISDTGLTDLRGISLTAVQSINVNNNQYLKTINVQQLTNVTNALAFSANGPNLAIEFPNLIGAANLTFRDISSISIPALSNVDGSMGFYNNFFGSFAAPNLTTVGNTIAIVSCSNVSSVNFPSLVSIGGGLQLANNTNLKDIVGFPMLSQISGDINFYGTFDAVAFGSLTNVRGAANVVTSSQNQTICDVFNQAHSKQVIKGNVNCKVNTASSLTNGSSSSSGGSGAKSAATTNLRFDLAMPLTAAAAFVAAALFI